MSVEDIVSVYAQWDEQLIPYCPKCGGRHFIVGFREVVTYEYDVFNDKWGNHDHVVDYPTPLMFVSCRNPECRTDIAVDSKMNNFIKERSR